MLMRKFIFCHHLLPCHCPLQHQTLLRNHNPFSGSQSQNRPPAAIRYLQLLRQYITRERFQLDCLPLQPTTTQQQHQHSTCHPPVNSPPKSQLPPFTQKILKSRLNVFPTIVVNFLPHSLLCTNPPEQYPVFFALIHPGIQLFTPLLR